LTIYITCDILKTVRQRDTKQEHKKNSTLTTENRPGGGH